VGMKSGFRSFRMGAISGSCEYGNLPSINWATIKFSRSTLPHSVSSVIVHCKKNIYWYPWTIDKCKLLLFHHSAPDFILHFFTYWTIF
jgi:hypothetical protein